MRYLKSYKLFEGVMDEANTHIQTIKDILIDLEDDGCFVMVTPTPLAMAAGDEPDIFVRMEVDIPGSFEGKNIYSADTEEKLDEIYPVFDDSYKRMVSYMDSVGWGHLIVMKAREYIRKIEVYRYKMDVRFYNKNTGFGQTK